MSELRISPWPLGFYAPGLHMRVCAKCELKFEGDKRAAHCLECAVLQLKEDAHAAGALLVENERLLAENERLREAARKARAVLAQAVSAGWSAGGPTPEDTEAAFWSLDAALAEGGGDE